MPPPLVLIVEDSRDAQGAAAEFLRRAGFAVVTADNGQDALCRLAEKPAPDLMLLDMVLQRGGLDGNDVLDRIGPTAPPVIVWTGGGARLADFADTKVKRVLTKATVTADEVLDAVRSVLAEHPPAPDPRQPADPPAGGCP